jgi:4a-hydroxytetrahydrobiopterin dehydratase
MTKETLNQLSAKDCIPCRGGTPALKGEALVTLHRDLGHDWALIDDHHLEKSFQFADFKNALAFTNTVGNIAEAQNHHPEIAMGWGHVKVTIWSHKIDGLTESDFVLAAKVEKAAP